MLFLTTILPRLRFTLLAATLLLVVGLNNQAVATFRVAAKAGAPARVTGTPKGTVVKQKVMLEATSQLGPWLQPAAEAWEPAAPAAVTRIAWFRATAPAVRPSAVPDWFRTRLLEAALSPHAP
ncbi:hypothetical protein LJ737_10140 [Hymenobacter sp. 15J16-1T3B]|uniref:hypothetical protein n=1 Tax=Hymenobacter sp. 15J16-1T3B TaxID=2886941 RepID=UPI001D12C4B8|nr:hypothetical protein [Hymenobacter sp. 15J16-1T3B]MCC3157599.1 hypothetical protein [Hymenobacter sp. 15J16-1T3B]